LNKGGLISPFFIKISKMKVLFLTEALEFSLIPRKYPIISDDLTLDLRNETTGTVISPAITFSVTEKLNITITEQPLDFKTQNKYEITISNDSEIIYKGKLIVLDSGTDVQNYNYGSQTTSKYSFK
jgi:hypothetical protein